MPDIRTAILTISDRSSRGQREDRSGPALAEMIASSGWSVVATAVVEDSEAAIISALRGWIDNGSIDLILTTGGTGFAPRDVTPEATQKVIQRFAPGLAEAMRQESLRQTPHAMLSRGVAGISGRTLVINLPGSPKAASENLQILLPVLPHAVALLKDDPASEADHRAASGADDPPRTGLH